MYVYAFNKSKNDIYAASLNKMTYINYIHFIYLHQPIYPSFHKVYKT